MVPISKCKRRIPLSRLSVYNIRSMNKTNAKKYLSAIENSKKKFLTCEGLSRTMGIYPEIIAENLSFFEPMLAMDPSYNLKELIPNLKEYIEEENQKSSKVPVIKVNKKELMEYKSVSDFVYKKMTTVGGLVDKYATLSETDLRILKKLVQQELDSLKTPKKKHK